MLTLAALLFAATIQFDSLGRHPRCRSDRTPTNRGGQDAEIPGTFSLLLVALLPLAGSPQTGEPSGRNSDGAHVSTSAVLDLAARSHLVESVHRSAGEDHSSSLGTFHRETTRRHHRTAPFAHRETHAEVQRPSLRAFIPIFTTHREKVKFYTHSRVRVQRDDVSFFSLFFLRIACALPRATRPRDHTVSQLARRLSTSRDSPRLWLTQSALLCSTFQRFAAPLAPRRGRD